MLADLQHLWRSRISEGKRPGAKRDHDGFPVVLYTPNRTRALDILDRSRDVTSGRMILWKGGRLDLEPAGSSRQ